MSHDVASMIGSARHVTVLTGAGVSTASGISDFRGPDGVWTKDPSAERLSHIDSYLRDADVRREAWRRRIEVARTMSGPNSAHRALVELERQGRLHMLITQNVDGLHRDAGTSSQRLIEIHGTARDVICLGCGKRDDAEIVYDRIAAGDEDPHCGLCGGMLKSATVSFGQSLDAVDMQRAWDAARQCDVMIAVGTTLLVFPVAGLPELALASGARLAVINAEPTAFDDRAEIVIRDDAGCVLEEVAKLLEPTTREPEGTKEAHGR